MHRNEEEKNTTKVEREHVEGLIEREMQVELYGSAAVNMMEKMGYKVGEGLGREQQGSTRLAQPCMELERAAQTCALGFGNYGPASTVAERAARLADVRAQKRLRVDEKAFHVHTLLSANEDEDGDSRLEKTVDIKLS